MNTQELFKEAIADAKALRKAALANAKKTIEEALAPKVESMLDKELAEMEDVAEAKDDTNENQFGMVNQGTTPGPAIGPTDPTADVDDREDTVNPSNLRPTNVKGKKSMEEELESILRELGMEDEASSTGMDADGNVTNMEEGEELDEAEDIEEGEEVEEATELDEFSDIEEADDDDSSSDDSAGDDMPADEPESDSDADMEAGAENVAGVPGDTPLAKITVDQLVDVVQSVVQNVVGGGEAGMEPGVDDMGAEPEMGAEPGMDGAEEPGSEPVDELDLDELLAELDGDVNESTEVEEGTEEVNEKEELNEAKQWYMKAAKGRKQAGRPGAVDETKAWYAAKPVRKGQAHKAGAVDESGSLMKPVKGNKKNIAPLKGKYSIKETGSLMKPIKGNKKNIAPLKGKFSLKEAKLLEAVKVINTLKKTLSETNLLNSKLLYANKLFKAKSLNENQKVKVISALDKARNINEAKTIYESLNETLSTKRTTLKESLGFASKPVGTAPTKPNIVEVDETVARWQKLAGIN